MIEPGTVILQHNGELAGSGGVQAAWLTFRRPIEILQADRIERIPAALEKIRQATMAGRHAAGFLSYEAAPAFDPAFVAHPAADRLPLLWFGLFESMEKSSTPPLAQPGAEYQFTPWRPELSRAAFSERIERIRQYIAAGDTYQVNFTFALRARFAGDPWRLFLDLQRAQGGRHGAFVWTGSQAIVSASPELFFVQSGEEVVTRPMKGTARRGRWLEQDEAQQSFLYHSPKDRAENVMIVDLLRNDLGRIARLGSVSVTSLFQIERYETVLQLTSTIRARTAAHPIDTLKALFPCGSITGAPKIRAMQIIRELETGPRGVYTGAIGWLGPDRQASFNVAIRTVRIERPSGGAVFGTGGGITWSSTAEQEYEECLLKSRLLSECRPDFDLLETLRWDPREGYFLLERHLARLAASALYFGRTVQIETVRRRLLCAGEGFEPHPQRVRLLVGADGTTRLEVQQLKNATGDVRRRVGLAREPVDEEDVFLYHKTTHRTAIDRARLSRPDLDGVILWNRRGELTESTTANLVVDFGEGILWTPARECGLLAGTFREELIAQGKIREKIIDKDQLKQAHRLWLINSVRQWMPVSIP